ncbi:GDP-mannose 4,6-dehydratase [Candidatus Pelagibacter sp. HIMB1695]|uniref:GDP-mannose 4,6-dehydratase n=1 Tax=Candidatus Pelagibacter sp. HIMB1695 TaxID=3413364 RepID=UPI003F860BBE
MKKKALIFGVTGQDGAYLSKLLLKKKYKVHGVKRRSSSLNTQRIDDFYLDPHQKTNFYLHYGDLSDSLSVLKIIEKVKPDEIYNLGAQSHVGVSFDVPEYTSNVTALGTLRILDSIRNLKMEKKVRYYQAGTSEMFGASKPPQSEKTNFYPRSPYAAAKLYSHWITINYREAYNIFACNGILFNHESPLRGETFVTRKIVIALCKILLGSSEKLYLGNLYSKRDWGHAEDYVLAMWKILQKNKPSDYVISSDKQYSVKYFVNLVCKELGIKIVWKGIGIKEKGFWNKKNIISIDRKYFRPTEVESLLGNSKKARKELNWKPKHNIKSLVKDMVNSEIKNLKSSRI